MGPALKPYAEDSDVERIVAWADSIEAGLTPDARDGDTHGFVTRRCQVPFATGFGGHSPRSLGGRLLRRKSRIFGYSSSAKSLKDQCSQAALDLAGELICRGVPEAAFSLHIIAMLTDSQG